MNDVPFLCWSGAEAFFLWYISGKMDLFHEKQSLIFTVLVLINLFALVTLKSVADLGIELHKLNTLIKKNPFVFCYTFILQV